MATISERKSQHGSTWQAKVRRKGHPTWSRTFDTKEEAETWASTKEASLEEGRDQDTDPAEILTVGELLAIYKMNMPDNTQLPLADMATSSLWNIPLTEVRPEDVRGFSREPNEATATLQAAIEFARRELDIHLARNPVTAAYAKPTQVRERRIPDYEEYILLEEAANTRGGYLRDAIIIALDTALMQHEIIKLDWSDVDLDKKLIKVNGKTGTRIIPITDRIITILKNKGIKANGLIFDGVSSMALQRAFIRTVERANLSDLHFNDLRYEALCRMLAKGLSPQQIWSIIGSKTLHPLARILGTSEGI
jgi:integrase